MTRLWSQERSPPTTAHCRHRCIKSTSTSTVTTNIFPSLVRNLRGPAQRQCSAVRVPEPLVPNLGTRHTHDCHAKLRACAPPPTPQAPLRPSIRESSLRLCSRWRFRQHRPSCLPPAPAHLPHVLRQAAAWPVRQTPRHSHCMHSFILPPGVAAQAHVAMCAP